MERQHIQVSDSLSGYDALERSRLTTPPEEQFELTFSPSRAFVSYNRIHKVLVKKASAGYLRNLHEELKDETLPDYLNAAGWSAAEAALIDEDSPAVERVQLLTQAETAWTAAIEMQEQIHASPDHEYLYEDTASFRYALNLAFIPLMKSLVVGNVTASIRERTFADVLAIAQAAGIQRELARKEGHTDAAGDYLGFEHECNALLALLFADDPRYFPLPSSARGGSGHDYPNQTHDIMVLNQHWGRLLKVVPVEIKASTTLRDIQRYDALLVRGKMHLSSNNLHSPEHIRNSFAAYYDGSATRRDNEAVYRVSCTIKELLRLYQQGKLKTDPDSSTKFHDTDKLIPSHPEFSMNRAQKY